MRRRDAPERGTGMNRAMIGLIRDTVAIWPGNWTVDLVGDVSSPAAVLLPDCENSLASSYHLECTPTGVDLSVVEMDCLNAVGRFDHVADALAHLAAVVRAEPLTVRLN